MTSITERYGPVILVTLLVGCRSARSPWPYSCGPACARAGRDRGRGARASV